MNVMLQEVKSSEVFSAFLMLKRGFLPTYFKYFDKVNPIFTSYSKFSNRLRSDKNAAFWIIADRIKVGMIELQFKDDMVHINNFYILKKYQNRGIGQTALINIHNKYSDCKRWHLFTIKQDKRNCYLYEKLGYISSGVEHRINKRMMLIEYEKRKDN